MNLLGKILVMLILVMSVVFMTLAAAVYSTHKNWRDLVQGPDGLDAQLQEARTQNEQLKESYNRLDSQLKGEIEAAQQQVRKLESERVRLADQNTAIRQELDQLQQERREATASVAATQQNNAALTAEVDGLREEIRENQQARDQAFASTLVATDDLHQLQGQLENTLERNRELTQDTARMTTVMRAEGINPGTDPETVMEPTDGLIASVRRSGGMQLIEVTIGADDGLRVGDSIEVFRGAKYLGRAEIIRTAPDRAIGRIDRRFQQGPIQEGDRVATRLKLS